MAKNNLQSAIYNLQSKAFTIVELLVAMSLLVILLALSGMVFSTTVAAHRAAGATIDVSRNLRAVTDQLNADFRGLQKDAPLMIWFEQEAFDSDDDGSNDSSRRYDQIFFFADGDFQTMGQYGVPAQTIHGNMSRIYYGHANSLLGTDYKERHLLSRRSHILTSDATLPILPEYDPLSVPPYQNFQGDFIPDNNNDYEYDTLTLTQWKNIFAYDADPDPTIVNPVNAEHVIESSMSIAGRSMVGFSKDAFVAGTSNHHLLMSQGVLSFRIQYADVDSVTGEVRWFPVEDMSGNGVIDEQDDYAIGLYYNMPASVTDVDIDGDGTNDAWNGPLNLPRALKFTIVLRDSNGIFADGKTFTHIVYIDN